MCPLRASWTVLSVGAKVADARVWQEIRRHAESCGRMTRRVAESPALGTRHRVRVTARPALWAIGNRQSAIGNRHWVCGGGVGVGVGVSEWTLTGTTLSGQRIVVRGLDLLEFDGHRQISRKGSFRKIVA